VTERQSGLRFDIYERIHLSEDTTAVRELNEVELVPDIQVYTEEEQALLKGHLYLTGSYLGENEEEQRTLEHLIPVEITLPLNRIQDVNQVVVDIDSFDVDILNSRSLNVTGVLTLHGIEMLSSTEEVWPEEEETVFVHEAASPYGDVSAQGARFEPDLAQYQEPSYSIREEAGYGSEVYQATETTWRSEETSPAVAVEPSPVKEKPSYPDEIAEVIFEADDEDEIADWPAAENANPEPAPQPPAEPSVESAAQEDKKELKIGFGSNSKNPAAEATFHLQSLIQTNEYRAKVAVEEKEVPTPRTDALEWKRLFSRTQDEERQFSKVRVCIVQKEDTLDSIADKYSLNPREIQLYNRLADAEVTEGKALFIPR
jgi:stage VI sporulation protein D